MVSEFVIGRRSGKNPVGAFKALAPEQKGWAGIGYMGVICAFLILAFYCTVAGGTIDGNPMRSTMARYTMKNAPPPLAPASHGKR